MIKYNYTTKQNSDDIYTEIIKSSIKEYPILPKDISILGITNSDKIKELLLLENEGIQETKLINIEENWFSLMSDFIKLNNSKLDLEKQLAYDSDIDSNDIIKEALSDEEIAAINNSISELTINIKDSFKLVTDLESRYPWLIEFRTNNDLSISSVRPVIKPQLTTSKKKTVIRHEINKDVRDIDDSIADLAKMNALLLSMLTGMYSILADADKDKIDPIKRGLIEYAISKWDMSDTRADRQLREDGTKLIDNLFSREVNIADIVDKYK